MCSWYQSPQCIQWLEIITTSPQGQWVNSLGPSDAISWQRSGSTLAQVMACCLMAPSHYLNQCWLILSKVQWHSSESIFTRATSAIYHWRLRENWLSQISFKSPRGQWVKNPWQWHLIHPLGTYYPLNNNSTSINIHELTHWCLMTQKCNSELGQHWFR